VNGGHFDWNIEAAGQTGDAGNPFPVLCGTSDTCDLSGAVAEGWIGFNFNHGERSRSRVHVGFYSASGDKSDTDKVESFIPLFGDFHGRLGYNDFFGASDIDDINAGYEVWLNDGRHMAGIYYHMFKENEPAPGDDDDLGDEIDLKYSFQWKPNVGLEVGYDMLNPGKAFEFTGFDPDTVVRGYVQLRTRW